MSERPIDPDDVEALIGRVLELSVPLHASIADFDEPDTQYVLEGAPGVAWFERDDADTIRHVSSSPSPMLMPVIDDLRPRHLAAAGVAKGVDNSHLPALLLLCCYLADPRAVSQLGIEQAARTRPARIRPVDEEAGQHDPPLEPRETALRAWVPLRAGHIPDMDATWPAILEMHFASDRYERHVPWEGRLGETATLPPHLQQ